MIHISDINWEWDNKSVSKFKTGDVVKAIILDVNEEKQRISLGIKQLDEKTFIKKIKDIKLKDIVTCSVIHIKESGVKVKLNNNLDGFIERKNLSVDESEQNPRHYAANEKLDAMIKKIDKENNKLLGNITELIEKGLFTSKDLKKDAEDLLKFKMEIIANKLNLVSREEFEVQKKIIEKLQKELTKLKIQKIKKKPIKVKKS